MEFNPLDNEDTFREDVLDKHLRNEDLFKSKSAMVQCWEDWLSDDRMDETQGKTVEVDTQGSKLDTINVVAS